MGRFDPAEIRAALHEYERNVDECSRRRDWRGFVDRFTDDVTYIEHAYGTFHGRDEVRDWVVATMAPFPQMRITQEWVAVDPDNDAIVFAVNNILDHPNEPGVEFSFPNLSRLVYGGDGLFASQEDVYNPARDADRVVGAWLRAGGELAAPPLPMKYR